MLLLEIFQHIMKGNFEVRSFKAMEWPRVYTKSPRGFRLLSVTTGLAWQQIEVALASPRLWDAHSNSGHTLRLVRFWHVLLMHCCPQCSSVGTPLVVQNVFLCR